MEFLDGLRKAKTLKTDFAKPLGRVTYHAACHLRAQKIAYPGMRVLSAVPNTEVRMVEQCSAVDGTWGMKAAYYEIGRKYAQKLVRGVKNSIDDADGAPVTVVTDCSLAGLRIQKENGVPALHPVEALATAYGLRRRLGRRRGARRHEGESDHEEGFARRAPGPGRIRANS